MIYAYCNSISQKKYTVQGIVYRVELKKLHLDLQTYFSKNENVEIPVLH
jgi:hypothetical protein